MPKKLVIVVVALVTGAFLHEPSHQALACGGGKFGGGHGAGFAGNGFHGRALGGSFHGAVVSPWTPNRGGGFGGHPLL